MKRIIPTFMLVLLMHITIAQVYAYDIESNGIYYNIISFEDLTCEVAPSSYSGNIVIPNYFNYNERQLKVIAIGDQAFKNCTELNSVNLPNTLKTIGKNAFYGCTKLKNIEIPQSLISISTGAFSGCKLERVSITSIDAWCKIKFESSTSTPFQNTSTQFFVNNNLCESLQISEYINAIGSYTFYNINTIKNISFPSSIITISNHAFYNCANLESINLPSSCHSIGDYAFYGCKQLSNVVIPSSTTSIGGYAFANCQLDAFHIDWSNEDITIGEKVFDCNVLYIQRNFKFAFTGSYIGNYIGNVTKVYIGNKVTNIYKGAFFRVDSLQEVVIEDSEEELSADPQSYTGNYTEFPSGSVVYYTIHNTTFEETNLRKIYLGRDINLYKSSGFFFSPFYDCKEVEAITIGNSVHDIEGVFSLNDCINLSSLQIGKNLSKIPDLTNNDSLNIIVLFNEDPPLATGFSNKTYMNCTLYVPKGSRTTYESAPIWKNFWNIIELDQNLVPATGISLNTTSLSFNAANQTSTLTATVMPTNATNKNVTWSSSNTSVAIVSSSGVVTAKANGTATITAKTTDGTNLTATCEVIVSIPILATGISLNRTTLTFNAANQTTTLTATVTPSNATNKNVTWTSNNTSVATVSNEGVVTSRGNGTAIITATTSDGTNLTATCTVTVTIVDDSIINFADANVKIICVANWDKNKDGELSKSEAAAVKYLGSVFKNNQQIVSFKELQYFTSVTSIGNYAFENCSGLTSVTIPNSVTSINIFAFSGCSGLTSVTIPNSVTSIGYYAFRGCSGLTSITIPNSVTSIDSAFSGCSGLTSVTIPNSVTSIDGAFFGCSSLESITIPNSVTEIGWLAFKLCSGLTSVIIPNSVTSIGDQAFLGCTSLTSVTIPNSVTSIGMSAFQKCSDLTSVTIPNSVTSIGVDAFYKTAWYNNQPDGLVYAGKVVYKYKGIMPNGTKITIEEGTLGIAEYAFYNCSNLTSVTIPNSVTSIGYAAFRGCTSLTDVYCYAEIVPNTDSDAFSYSNIESATLHVPAESIEQYKATNPWSKFGSIVPLTDEDAIEDVKASMGVTETARYDLNGRKQTTPQRGINIIRYSDGTTRKVIVKQ